jgi:hypothetical protein
MLDLCYKLGAKELYARELALLHKQVINLEVFSNDLPTNERIFMDLIEFKHYAIPVMKWLCLPDQEMPHTECFAVSVPLLRMYATELSSCHMMYAAKSGCLESIKYIHERIGDMYTQSVYTNYDAHIVETLLMGDDYMPALGVKTGSVSSDDTDREGYPERLECLRFLFGNEYRISYNTWYYIVTHEMRDHIALLYDMGIQVPDNIDPARISAQYEHPGCLAYSTGTDNECSPNVCEDADKSVGNKNNDSGMRDDQSSDTTVHTLSEDNKDTND